jgi:hypothetical protein
MSVVRRSVTRSAVNRLARSGSRTGSERRPPRPYGLFALSRVSLWQQTTRPPHSGRAGGLLPVEAGVAIPSRAGRTPLPAGGARRRAWLVTGHG